MNQKLKEKDYGREEEFVNETTFKINNANNEREKLWAKRKISKDEQERTIICKDIATLTNQIENLRKEVQLAKDIETRIPKIEDNLNELDYQEEQEKNKDNEKNKYRKEK